MGVDYMWHQVGQGQCVCMHVHTEPTVHVLVCDWAACMCSLEVTKLKGRKYAIADESANHSFLCFTADTYSQDFGGLCALFLALQQWLILEFLSHSLMPAAPCSARSFFSVKKFFVMSV